MSIAIKRNFILPAAIGTSELFVTASIASTSVTSGAMQVIGGAGISGNVSLGGQLQLFNGSFYTGFDSAATASTTYIWPTTSPATGTSVLSSDPAGNLSWILMSALGSGAGLTLNGLTSTTQYFSTSISGSGFTISSIGSTHTYYIGLAGNASTGLMSGAAQTIFGLKTFASGVAITSGTASTNTTTGDLVVSGGVGIGQTLNVSGNIYQNTNAITAYDTGFRNRIINGDGNIDQRNSGTATTPGVGAVNFIDRWKMNVFGSGRLTIGRNYGGVTPPDGFISYIGMKTTTTSTPAANDYNFLTQMIEGSNLIDLQFGTANAKSFTISFWAYSSLTGTFGGSVRNSSATRSYPFTYTISSSNTWEKKTIVIPGDTTGTWSTSHLGGLEIIFVISNGTTWQAAPFEWVAANATGPNSSLVNLIGTLNATLYLTGIQAEIGSVATPYERRNYGHEFALCQRYYQITEVRTGGYHTTGGELRGSGYLSAAMRPITSPVLTVLATDESVNLGTLNVNDSNFRGDSFRYIVAVTSTGTAYGQWKVSCDTEF